MTFVVQSLDSNKLSNAFDVLCQTLYPIEGVVAPPFGSAWFVVEPGKKTRSHNHHEAETWFVFKGKGVLHQDGEAREVQVGDVIYLPPFGEHTLINEDSHEDLVFLTVYWEDLKLLRLQPKEEAAKQVLEKRVLITATPPTPNGDLHIGHLSGPYLGADIYRRSLLLEGRPVHYLTGVDDHQNYVSFKASHVGESARETADRFGHRMKATLDAAQVETDVFAFPQSSAHYFPMVEEFFSTLFREGKLVVRDAPSLHCETCDEYLFDAFVRGRCPHCSEPSGGGVCEECGRPNDYADLLEPHCNRCGSPPILRITRRLYFPLEAYRDQLVAYHQRVSMNPHMRLLCESMLTEELPEIAISHFSDWGAPVPCEGFEDQRLYVWAEMAAGYLAATQELADKTPGVSSWRDFWCSDDAEVVQFFGFDNGYFHAILFPALFHAFDPSIRPPSSFVVNEFYLLEGKKFSTSRLHVVWGGDLLSEVAAERVRFHLALTGPERSRTSFSREALDDTVKRELLGEWTAWLRGLTSVVFEDFDGAVPATGLWSEGQEQFYYRLQQLDNEVREAYEAVTFSPQRAARGLCELVRCARRFCAEQQHWRRLKERRDDWRTAVALELTAARQLALLSAPILPAFAERLWRHLGEEGSLWDASGEQPPPFLTAGLSLGAPEETFFPDIDERIAIEREGQSLAAGA